MPTYDYVCKSCGYEFEEFHKMSDPAVEKCPKCEGKVKKKISGGAGVLFKGSGFYITDYKNKDNGRNNKNTESKSKEKSESNNGSKPKE